MYLPQRPCVSSYVCERHLASRWQAMSVKKLKTFQIAILRKPNSATAVKHEAKNRQGKRLQTFCMYTE